MHRHRRAPEALHRRAREVRRQFQERRGALQVRDLRLQVLRDPGVACLALPDGEVQIVVFQSRRRRARATGLRVVESPQLANQDAGGPAVRDDVVQADEQDVLQRRQSQQGDAQQAGFAEVELRAGVALDLRRHGLALDIADLQLDANFVHYLLARPVGRVEEASAQARLAVHHRVKRALQRLRIDRPVQAQRGGNVVEAAVLLDLRQHPQSLLRVRQRLRLAHVSPTQGSDRRGRGGSGRDCGEGDGQRLDRRVFEQRAQGHVQAELRAHARDDLGGEQRVAAEQEEIVTSSDTFTREKRGPEFGDLRLQARPRHQVPRALASVATPRRQRLAVDLAIGQQRQRLAGDDFGWDHWSGQPPLQERAQHGCGRPSPGARYDPRHEDGVAGRPFQRPHVGIHDVRLGEQRAAHFAGLDAVPSDLHLVVVPA